MVLENTMQVLSISQTLYQTPAIKGVKAVFQLDLNDININWMEKHIDAY